MKVIVATSFQTGQEIFRFEVANPEEAIKGIIQRRPDLKSADFREVLEKYMGVLGETINLVIGDPYPRS